MSPIENHRIARMRSRTRVEKLGEACDTFLSNRGLGGVAVLAIW